MRAAWLLLVLVAQDKPAPKGPEPGPIPAGLVILDDLDIPAGRGDAAVALRTFLDAHALHKKGNSRGALRGYLTFLGIPGRTEIPKRYTDTARKRIAAVEKEAGDRYGKAVATYRKDRARGLAALRRVADLFPMLPAGKAATEVWHTDRIYAAMAEARALDKGGERLKARAGLERAVRRYRSALYRYEAKSLLLDLGGPDLFEPGERVGEDGDGDAGKKKKKKKGEESTIEVSDG